LIIPRKLRLRRSKKPRPQLVDEAEAVGAAEEPEEVEEEVVVAEVAVVVVEAVEEVHHRDDDNSRRISMRMDDVCVNDEANRFDFPVLFHHVHLLLHLHFSLYPKILK
jgi:hypothetical protein